MFYRKYYEAFKNFIPDFEHKEKLDFVTSLGFGILDPEIKYFSSLDDTVWKVKNDVFENGTDDELKKHYFIVQYMVWMNLHVMESLTS